MNWGVEILPLPGDVEISTIYLEEERPTRLFDIDYLKPKVSKTQKAKDAEQKETQTRKKKPASWKKSNLRFVGKRKSTRPPKPRF
jgi:hypothetical protein